MQPEITTETSIRFGCEHFGSLKKVLLHTPGKELHLINETNKSQWLFDRVPDIPRFIDEHRRYADLLSSLGVEVLQLTDYLRTSRPLVEKLPNMTYLHDTAVITSKGAILSKMALPGRHGEQLVLKEALANLSIPIFHEFTGQTDAFEGCLLLSPRTILVADTERHKEHSIRKFITKAVLHFDEVIFVRVPKTRRFMHPDTIYNRLTENLALAYLPAFENACLYTAAGAQPIDDFQTHMASTGIHIINVSDAEQKNLACSFVPIQPGTIIHYDHAFAPGTKHKLAKKNIRVIPFHAEALPSGGGSLRCHTLRLLRA